MMKTETPNVLHKAWFLLTVCTIFYSFFFQYGVKSVSGLMMVLCALLIACAVAHILVIDRGVLFKSNLRPILGFVFTAVISTIFTAKGLYGSSQSIRMIEYVLVGYSLYLLLSRYPQFINGIMWSFTISISLTSFFVVTRGVVSTSAGGIGLGTLNINTMSSYILLAFFSAFYLLLQKLGKLQSVLLIFMNCICMVALVAGASRRGFVVGVIFILFSIFFALIPAISKKKSYKRFVWSFVFIVIIGLISYFAFDYIMNNTSLGIRLMGINNAGDSLRERYQNFAISAFIEHPIFGIGLGGVEYNMGAYSHSLYYETLACTGVFSGVFLGYGIIKYLLDMLKQKKWYVLEDNNKFESVISLSIVFLFSIILTGIAVVMIYELYFYIVMSIIAIIITNHSNMTKDISDLNDF
ncbi:hypothetical protein GKG47_21465 [Lactonifactor sp. BIOML-A3]|uniref:O-antigen ligase family protein n=1 Tax=unclassified Lactonifactor TaxID=2636670 RepID=UPI0012B0D0B4|nr:MULTISPECIES: O-antigen ligase family protein [unclassified Lactonifactor]MSA03914.1 hypothetical protein [Lactonifactor sp. BIOML-A5]MSA10470.1 hypothetical protein [Lactonifactor sp. BIOML-A4]MSA14973.1 hypothetical protein [Lactonifactor sp. BIOML-A3]MSA19391.1 hypothetical protein [Lactonifactor sp. BIOML-A2]MSA39971.1 hypothetical protein [Lactonifactor sp. BIOML-A1]